MNILFSALFCCLLSCSVITSSMTPAIVTIGNAKEIHAELHKKSREKDAPDKFTTTAYMAMKQCDITGIRNYVDQSEQLFSLCLTPEKIKQLHAAGADIDYTLDTTNCTWPLLFWVQKNNYRNVKTLLELGADVNQSYRAFYPEKRNLIIYQTCITEAYNNTKMLKLLLSYEPDHVYLIPAIKHNCKEDGIELLVAAIKKRHKHDTSILDDVLLYVIAKYNKYIKKQKDVLAQRYKSIATLLLEQGVKPDLTWKWIIDFAKHENIQNIQKSSLKNITALLRQYPVIKLKYLRRYCLNGHITGKQILQCLDSIDKNSSKRILDILHIDKK